MARRLRARLAAEGAEWFGVATPEEGIELDCLASRNRYFALVDSGRGKRRVAFSTPDTRRVPRRNDEALDRVARAAEPWRMFT